MVDPVTSGVTVNLWGCGPSPRSRREELDVKVEVGVDVDVNVDVDDGGEDDDPMYGVYVLSIYT